MQESSPSRGAALVALAPVAGFVIFAIEVFVWGMVSPKAITPNYGPFALMIALPLVLTVWLVTWVVFRFTATRSTNTRAWMTAAFCCVSPAIVALLTGSIASAYVPKEVGLFITFALLLAYAFWFFSLSPIWVYLLARRVLTRQQTEQGAQGKDAAGLTA